MQPFPYYSAQTKTRPAKFLSLSGVAALTPTIGPKDKAALFTPYKAEGKTKDIAQAAAFYALVQDHDDDDKPRFEIAATYDAIGCAYYAFTTSNHLQDKNGKIGNRWKVVIPFAEPIQADYFVQFATGAALKLETDPAQVRLNQITYAPNKLFEDAPFEIIDATDRPLIDAHSHPFAIECVAAYKKSEAQKQKTAKAAKPKPRSERLINGSGGIIDKTCEQFDLECELEGRGYLKIGRAFLSPESESGIPGVYILKGKDGKERVYSHHGPSDPLSAHNHDGHALDAFDVICTFDYGGDVQKAVAALAPKVDPEGQKQRQREHMQQQQPAIELSQVEPVDLFSSLTLPPFPIELLPDVLRRFTSDQSELIGVDPAVIGMSGIAGAAACIDDRLQVQVKRHDVGWTESARLWVAIIGDPSAKKSPGIKKALGPLFGVDKDWREETARRKAAWIKSCKEAEKAGNPAPPRPLEKRLIINDTTVEKLGDILAYGVPRGILCYQDELTGWMASMDAYKNGSGKDRAAWLEMYNGGGKAIDRIQRGSLWVENWSACVVGGIQPQVVHEYAKNTNHDGMLQRFLLIHAGEATLGKDRAHCCFSYEDYYEALKYLCWLDYEKRGVVRLSEEAHSVREELDRKLLRATRNHPNQFLAAALGKWNGLFARLALTMHALECAAETSNPKDKVISGETAHLVSSLIWGVCLPHAVRFFQELDPAEDFARKVAGWILASGRPRFLVKRDMNREIRESRKLDRWQLEAALDRLEAFGWIAPEDGKLNEHGRPVAYQVNPAVHIRFKAQAERERERRKEITELMSSLGCGE